MGGIEVRRKVSLGPSVFYVNWICLGISGFIGCCISKFIKQVKGFNITTLAAMVILLAALFFTQQLTHIGLQMLVVPVLYALLNLYLYKKSSVAVAASPRKFVNSYMVAVTIKLLFTIVLVTVMVLVQPEVKIATALLIFGVYLVNTVLFSRALLRLR